MQLEVLADPTTVDDLRRDVRRESAQIRSALRIWDRVQIIHARIIWEAPKSLTHERFEIGNALPICPPRPPRGAHHAGFTNNWRDTPNAVLQAGAASDPEQHPHRRATVTDMTSAEVGLSRAHTAAGQLQRHLLRLLRVHERDDMLPTSARFLWYELETEGVVSKVRTGARRTDQNTHDALTHLREAG